MGTAKSRFWFFRLRSQRLFSLNHSLHTVVHVLHQVLFRATQTPLVRYVVDVVVSLCVFAMCAAYLDMETVCDGLELRFLVAEQWQVDMHGRAQSSA